MLKTRCVAALSVAVAVLAAGGVARATPATPAITVQQTSTLKMRLTSSTGTHWAWTIVDAQGAVVATSTTNPATPTFAAAGDYLARLDATDDDPLLTAPAHAQVTFHVYATPVAAFTAAVLANGTVQLTDASTGEPTAWVWTFPGSTFKGRVPPPQALPVGTSNVTLKVTNPAGAHTITQPVIVNGPPVAVMNIMSTPAAINSSVLLDAGHSTDPNLDPLSFAWDLNGDQQYGDGTGPLQAVSWAKPGVYRVGVQVSDGHGAMATAAAFVTVLADAPPVVAFTNRPEQPTVGAPVSLAATASDPDGTIAGVTWDLDDDGQFDDAAGPTATWTFQAAGSYLVAVRAIDDQGVATIAFRTITVLGLAAPVAATSGAAVPTMTSAPLPAPSSALGTLSPEAPTSSSRRPQMLTPFPIVRIRGLIYSGSVRISLLTVQAPAGATIRVRCRGRSCSTIRRDISVKAARRPVRVRKFDHRSLRPGTILEVFVTAPHRIGKYTRFRVRRDAAPARSDRCLQPGRFTPTACPTA